MLLFQSILHGFFGCQTGQSGGWMEAKKKCYIFVFKELTIIP
jgi:hypothetical protein